ncbi:MAG: hypothetical protein RIQ60_2101 [Pseudomonadota bacterium]|jgi:S1-C subfamily serine protease
MARTPLYSRPAAAGREVAPTIALPHGTADPRAGAKATAAATRNDVATPLPAHDAQAAAPTGEPSSGDILPTAAPARRARADWRQGLARPGWLVVLPVLLLALWSSWTVWHTRARSPQLTIEQIDAAMRESIAKQPLRSAAALAYENIIPAVVRVVAEHDARPGAAPAPAAASAPTGAPRKAPQEGKTQQAGKTPGATGAGGRGDGRDAARAAPPATPDRLRRKGEPGPPDADEEEGRSVGTGVVIVDKGIILTNLHVIAGADRIKLTFWDGSESLATVMNLMPEHDLAVLQAHTIPDDLHAATLRSTADLQPGDEVLAVGFPFGIGPSASTGVVSGLKREFRTGEGRRTLSNLIQFDAAANPGNSGGPLVTMDGHVVGIVTAIMNPNAQRTFIGIGFAVPIENAAAGAGLAPF